MRQDSDRPDPSEPRAPARRRALLTGLLLAVSVLAAACGGGGPGEGVASVGTSGRSTGPRPAPSKSSAKANPLAYSQCMRAHGITNFPDPNSQGRIDVNQKSGVNLGSPQFQSARRACKSLAPSGETSAQQAQQTAAALEYAKCMRAHGVPHFPDPNGQGGFQIRPSSGIDASSPQVQSADKTCHHFLAKTRLGGQTVTKGLP